MPRTERKPEKIALLLQGGGALGSYQAGAYEALAAAKLLPSWIAGISIGAVNGAIIAGNPPELAATRLAEFWRIITESASPFPLFEEMVESAIHSTGTTNTLLFGAPGFFTPRTLSPFGSNTAPADLSYYDTRVLRSTLESVVDFDRINDRKHRTIRLSVGAVGIKTGNIVFFDNQRMRIGPEHIMASGALPPGLPPIEVDGEYYWDGGLVSNTPLQYLVDEDGPDDILAFQVDLFSARGPMPRNLLEAAEREKDIRYSSRTRFNTDEVKRRQAVTRAATRLLKKLPPHLRDDPDLAELQRQGCGAALTLVHFIYKTKYDAAGFAKDYQFSRSAIDTHWSTGKADVEAALKHPDWRRRKRPEMGEIKIFDLASYPTNRARTKSGAKP